MVVPAAGVPLLKLLFLAVKQVSKPIANRAKASAAESEKFKGLVVGIGRSIHRLQIQIWRFAEGKVSLEYISPLSEKAAIDKGSEFVSELVIYSLAAATTIYEYGRQQQEKKLTKLLEAEAERKKREEQLDNERRQWEAFADVGRRMTVVEEQMLDLRRENATLRGRSRLGAIFGFGSRASAPPAPG